MAVIKIELDGIVADTLYALNLYILFARNGLPLVLGMTLYFSTWAGDTQKLGTVAEGFSILKGNSQLILVLVETDFSRVEFKNFKHGIFLALLRQLVSREQGLPEKQAGLVLEYSRVSIPQ